IRDFHVTGVQTCALPISFDRGMGGSRGPQRRVHRVEGRLRPAMAIEEQRVIDATPGEVIEPALAVVQVPEGNPLDEVAVLVEERSEERRVGKEWRARGAR